MRQTGSSSPFVKEWEFVFELGCHNQLIDEKILICNYHTLDIIALIQGKHTDFCDIIMLNVTNSFIATR